MTLPPPGEDGTITLLTLGLGTVALALVATVVDVSAVFLARRDLAGTCDHAAVAAGSGAARPLLYAPGDPAAASPRTLPLDLPTAQRAAAAAARSGGAVATVVRHRDGSLGVSCRRGVDLPLGSGTGLGPVGVRADADVETPLR